nr:TolC family protein [Psychrobacter sp. PraFG1]UNK06524.1 TolC family protein [Psychrobacter sp. PraFG1]
MAFNDASFYNPSVVKEIFQIESAKQEVKAQNASKYPTVYAEYKHTYDYDNKEDDGQFYVGLNYQPGAGFSNFALTRASEARVNSLVQNKEAAQRNVMENIQVQYQQFASARSRELSLVSAVAGAQIVLDSYQRQFIAGRKSWLEVLNAVRELSDYQIRLVQTRSDILGAFYKLQVDFSLMPWQTFAKNRQPVKMFKVSDPVKDWMNTQNITTPQSQNSATVNRQWLMPASPMSIFKLPCRLMLSINSIKVAILYSMTVVYWMSLRSLIKPCKMTQVRRIQ